MPEFATHWRWPITCILYTALSCLSMEIFSQPMSGVWKGRLGAQNLGARSYSVEMTVVRDGDSLRGLSDYRTQGNHHVKMPVRGYINPYDGTVTWWHAALSGIDENGRAVPDLLPIGMTFNTDFNCPDGSTLKLDGTAHISTWSGRTWEIPVHLEKTAEVEFQDDFNTGIVKIDPKLEDSKPTPLTEGNPSSSKPVQRPERQAEVAPAPPKANLPEKLPPSNPVVQAAPKPAAAPAPTPAPPAPMARRIATPEPSQRGIIEKENTPPSVAKASTPVVSTTPPPKTPKPIQAIDDQPTSTKQAEPSPLPPPTPTLPSERTNSAPTTDPQPLHIPILSEPKTEEMFLTRGKNLVQEIEVSGDTLWLHFYDHAEVDGDSISIFLDNQLLASHIRLQVTPHTMGIPLTAIKDSADLTMVAENLGEIPPNTSLLILYVEGVRHEARLESTEKTSAMIRFRKPIRKK